MDKPKLIELLNQIIQQITNMDQKIFDHSFKKGKAKFRAYEPLPPKGFCLGNPFKILDITVEMI